VTSVPYLLGHSYRLRDLLDHDDDLDQEETSLPRIPFRTSGPRRAINE